MGDGAPADEDARRVAELQAQLDHERLYPLEWANRRVRDRLGNEVQAGPFKGLRFHDWAITGVNMYAPKLIGSYEQELHPALELAIASRPPVVVNVGAGEGYFSVGLARRLPRSHVVAFEVNEVRALHAREIAALNEVDVDVRQGECTHADLAELLSSGGLVVCDCDGCEDVLLDPERVPALRGSAVIVECHDLWRAGITDRLMEAFAPSHDLELVPAEPRYVDDHPELGDIPLVTRQLAISEFRGAPMDWLVAWPRPSQSLDE